MTEIAAFAVWERRKAELAARRAAALADPVQGFYLRPGRPSGRAGQVPGEEEQAAEDEEPGTALKIEPQSSGAFKRLGVSGCRPDLPKFLNFLLSLQLSYLLLQLGDLGVLLVQRRAQPDDLGVLFLEFLFAGFGRLSRAIRLNPSRFSRYKIPRRNRSRYKIILGLNRSARRSRCKFVSTIHEQLLTLRQLPASRQLGAAGRHRSCRRPAR